METDNLTTKVRPRRRVWARFLIVVALLAGLGTLCVVVGALYLQSSVTKVVDDAVAETARLDPGWRLDEIEAKREVLPDETNGALKVLAVLADLPDNWKNSAPQNPPGAPHGSERPVEGLALHNSLPGGIPNVLLSNELARLVDAETERVNSAIVLARELANFPKGRTKITWLPNHIEILLPHAQNSRYVAQLLDLDAIERSQNGDDNGALESCHAILNVGRSLGDEPIAISQLVRIAITSSSITAVERTLARGEPGDKAMAALQDALAAESNEPLALNALRGERALVFRLLGYLDTGEVPLDRLSGGGTSSAVPGVGPAAHLMFRYNQGLSLRTLTSAVEIARKPDHEQPPLWNTWKRELDPKTKSKFAMMIGALTYAFTPAMDAVAAAGIRSHATAGLGAVLLAAERFRKAKGDWPTSLERIEKEFAVKLPLDPYSGAPFRLTRTDDGLILYSVGPDQVDNDGNLNNRAGANVLDIDYGYKLWDVAKRRQKPEAGGETTPTP